MVRLSSFMLLAAGCGGELAPEALPANTPPPEVATARCTEEAPVPDPPSPFEACSRARAPAPGTRVYCADTVGTASCAGISAGNVLDVVFGEHPSFVDLRASNGDMSDRTNGYGNIVFARPDGGFDVVIEHVLAGDWGCYNGCIYDYFYFETDAQCVPRLVGTSTQDYGSCFESDEAPRWNIPQGFDPQLQCGADLAPQQLPAHVVVPSCGSVTRACDAGPNIVSPSHLELFIEQAADDLGHAIVSVHAPELPELAAYRFAGTVTGSRLRAGDEPVDDSCTNRWVRLSLLYDFAGGVQSTLELQYLGYPDCSDSPTTSCQLSTSPYLTLGAP